MNTENLHETVNRLTKSGYTDDFKAEPNGLRSRDTGKLISPETLVIEETIRFEGETNPDDEAIVFALSDPKTGIKGTYTVAYGPSMESADIDMVSHLHTKAKS